MGSSTTAIERLLEVSNKLWDAMYESGEVPTYAERYYYYLALKDAMDENRKLRELMQDMFGAYKGAVEMMPSSYTKNVMEMAVMDISDHMRELGVETNT